MSAIQPPGPKTKNTYPTSDGKPMAETDLHRDLMLQLIEILKEFYRSVPNVYVSGNLLLFYEQGNRRRHVSPDVFVVRGVEKRERENYLVWEEKKGPQLVIELTPDGGANAQLKVVVSQALPLLPPLQVIGYDVTWRSIWPPAPPGLFTNWTFV